MWQWDDEASEMLRETATWLGVAVRLVRLRADHERANVRAERLRAESSAARERLARRARAHRRTRAHADSAGGSAPASAQSAGETRVTA